MPFDIVVPSTMETAFRIKRQRPLRPQIGRIDFVGRAKDAVEKRVEVELPEKFERLPERRRRHAGRSDP